MIRQIHDQKRLEDLRIFWRYLFNLNTVFICLKTAALNKATLRITICEVSEEGFECGTGGRPTGYAHDLQQRSIYSHFLNLGT